MTGRVAKNLPATLHTATSTRNRGVHAHAADAGRGEDGHIDADVVSTVGEGDRGDLHWARPNLPGLSLCLVSVPIAMVPPAEPGGLQAQSERQQTR